MSCIPKITVNKGEKGDPGANGLQGPPGPPGPTTPLTVLKDGNVISSTVTQVNFTGINAQVVVSNTSGDEVTISIDSNSTIECTHAEAINFINTSTLIPNTYYRIYDVGDGIGLTNRAADPNGIILRAISSNKFSISGAFIAKIPNRSVVTDVFANTTIYAIDAYTECCNEVYKNITGAVLATTPAQDVVNWVFIPKDDTTYYTTEIQECLYDITTNVIKQRSDIRGNVLSNNGTSNYVILNCFRWGLSTFNNNKISYTESGTTLTNRFPSSHSTILGISTLKGEFRNNNIYSGGYFYDIGYLGNTANHYNNEIYDNSGVILSDETTFVINSTMNSSSIISGNTNTQVTEVKLDSSSIINCVDCLITNVRGTTVTIDTLDTCTLNNILFTEGKYVLNLIQNSTNCIIDGAVIQGLSFTNSSNIILNNTTVERETIIDSVTTDVASIGSGFTYTTFKNIQFGPFEFQNGVTTLTFSDFIGLSGGDTISGIYDATYTEGGLTPGSGDGSSLSTSCYLEGVSINTTTGKLFFNPKASDKLYITPQKSLYGVLLNMSTGAIYNSATDTLTLTDHAQYAGKIYLQNTALADPIVKIINPPTTKQLIFKNFNGTGVIFTPTLLASHVGASGDFQSDGGNVTILNEGDFYEIYFEYLLAGTHNYYKLNAQTVL